MEYSGRYGDLEKIVVSRPWKPMYRLGWALVEALASGLFSPNLSGDSPPPSSTFARSKPQVIDSYA